MASINLEPPVSTPSNEWAASTTNALHSSDPATAATATASKESTHRPNIFSTPSGASTPGNEFPGSFPRDAQSQTQSQPMPSTTTTEERTPRAAALHMSDAAPAKTTMESAREYMPDSGSMQRAVDMAKSYLPGSVAGAVDSMLPASMSNGSQTEKPIDSISSSTPTTGTQTTDPTSGTGSKPTTTTGDSQTSKILDPTSGAQPATGNSVDRYTSSLDNASTTAIAPSSVGGSITSREPQGSSTSTPPANPNPHAGLISALDGNSSSAQPNTFSSPSSAVSAGASSQPKSASVNAGDAAVAMHALPTPPSSKDNSPPDLLSTTQSPTRAKKDESFPVPGGQSQSHDSKHTPVPGPTPPAKESTSRFHEEDPSARSSQPKLNTTPPQEHIKSGSGVRSHLPGTGPPANGDGAHPSESPKSEISDPHIDEHADAHKTELPKGSAENDTAKSSDENLEGEKKEGRVKGLVNKVKDKLSHRGH